ncbi:MAG: hypothetical protein ABI821_15695 [Pseudomonadota bacterium]
MKNNLPDAMNRARVLSAALGLLAYSAGLPAVAADGLCGTLREFTKSVKPGETRALRFNTILGSNFKDREVSANGAKRCDFSSYEPAKAVCKYLMEFGSAESAGYNAKSAITCLSPNTRFAAGTRLGAIAFSMPFGLAEHPGLVDVAFTEDKDLGGMVLSITAAGPQVRSSSRHRSRESGRS